MAAAILMALLGNSPCVPMPNRTLVAIGQDLSSVEHYAAAFGAPAVVSAYTAIDTLRGLGEPVDYGGGVQHAAALLDAFPGASLLLAVYAVGELANVTSGLLDHRIDELGGWIARARVPVYVRFGYECDNPTNWYEPEAFVAAFRYFVTRLRERGVPNVAHVWHPWGFEPAGGRDVLSWWPGGEYVDWVGLSAFQQLFTGETRHMEAVATIAKTHGLPLMICEATPFGGLVPRPGSAPPPANATGERRVPAADTWHSWFVPLLAFVRAHDVRLLAYIDCDWEAQPMWTGGGWGDTRIEAEPTHSRLWRQLLGEARFDVGPGGIGCKAGTSTALARSSSQLAGGGLPLPQPAPPAEAPRSQAEEGERQTALARSRASKARAVWGVLAGVGLAGLAALALAQRPLLGAARERGPTSAALLADGDRDAPAGGADTVATR